MKINYNHIKIVGLLLLVIFLFAFSSNLVTGTWVGAENPSIHFKSMDKGQGSHSALPINGNFLKSLNNDPSFKYYLTGNFKKPSKEVLKMYDCLSRKGVPPLVL